MTTNDKLFLQTLHAVAQNNKQGSVPKTVATNKALISDELLSVFDIDKGASGAWMFNVYVEFEPMFKTPLAKDWQV